MGKMCPDQEENSSLEEACSPLRRERPAKEKKDVQRKESDVPCVAKSEKPEKRKLGRSPAFTGSTEPVTWLEGKTRQDA